MMLDETFVKILITLIVAAIMSVGFGIGWLVFA